MMRIQCMDASGDRRVDCVSSNGGLSESPLAVRAACPAPSSTSSAPSLPPSATSSASCRHVQCRPVCLIERSSFSVHPPPDRSCQHGITPSHTVTTTIPSSIPLPVVVGQRVLGSPSRVRCMFYPFSTQEGRAIVRCISHHIIIH